MVSDSRFDPSRDLLLDNEPSGPLHFRAGRLFFLCPLNNDRQPYARARSENVAISSPINC